MMLYLYWILAQQKGSEVALKLRDGAAISTQLWMPTRPSLHALVIDRVEHQSKK